MPSRRPGRQRLRPPAGRRPVTTLAPAAPAGAARARRPGCLLPSLALAVVALAVAFGLFVGWERLAPEDRETLQLSAAGALDAVREAPGIPAEVRLGVDRLLDRLPAHVGATVRAPAPWDSPSDAASFGGDPRPTDGREVLVLANRGYRVGWDVAAAAPAWVAFRLHRAETRTAPPRPDTFRADPRLPSAPPLRAWEGSGYDRGHLAPSRAIGICHGDTAMEETFLASNLVPQLPELNRGLWRRLEARQVDRVAVVLGEVWVTVGPLYEGVRWRRRLSPDGPPVPDSFFVALLDRRDDGSLRTLALRVPQRPIGAPPPGRLLVSVDAVENQASLDLHPDLPTEVQVPLEAMIPARFW